MKDLNNIYTYHRPSALQNMKYDMIRAYAKQLADAIETVCPDSREKSLAHTNLEQATMWANASIARNEDPQPMSDPFHAPMEPVKTAQPCQNYPPDPFDFVATGEMEEAPEPGPKTQTRFDLITKSPEVLAEFLSEEFDRCPPAMDGVKCDNACILCWCDQLREEVRPDG